jgi:hypothetical protein
LFFTKSLAGASAGLYLLLWFPERLRKEKNRMMSRKWMVGFTAVVLMLALAPSSFAQIELKLFNTPAAMEVNNDRHARTADLGSIGAGLLVSGTLIANSSLSSLTFTLTFPAVVTTSGTFPNGTEGIRIEGATGVFATINTFTRTSNTLTFILPEVGNNNQSGSFRVTGIRLDANNLAMPANLVSAVLSSSAHNYIAPNVMPTLITTSSAGLSAPVIGPDNTTAAGTITIFTNQVGGVYSDATSTITLGEGFASAWRTSTQGSVNGTGTGIFGNGFRFTIKGMPLGTTVTITPRAGGPVLDTADGVGLNFSAGSTTNTDRTATFLITSTDNALMESKNFDIVLTGTPTAGFTAGAITLTATMAPVAPATSGAGSCASPFHCSTVPKFLASETAALTIGNVVVAKTTMLLPYVVSIGAGGSTYNTGVAIANTTLDPFGVAGGGATATAGRLTFHLYQRSATGAAGNTSYSTSATVAPGSGLSTTGTVVAGGTWSGLMSEILSKQTALTGDFIGYMFVEAEFLGAHGVAYLLTGGNISSGLPVGILPPPAGNGRNNPGGFGASGGEFLGY